MVDISLLQKGAIRSRLYLGGKFITRDAVPVSLASKRFEVKTRTSNLAMRVDRAFTDVGNPNVRNRREFTLPWANIVEPEILEHLDVLCSVGQPFPFGLWKHEYDVFDGTADAATVYWIQRRQLLPSVTPSVTWPDYPTRVTGYSGSYLDPSSTPTEFTVVAKAHADFDTGGPSTGEAWVENEGTRVGNLWKTRVRIGDAIAAASDDLVISYLPMYECIIDAEAPRSYAQALMEPRNLKMIEFG